MCVYTQTCSCWGEQPWSFALRETSGQWESCRSHSSWGDMGRARSNRGQAQTCIKNSWKAPRTVQVSRVWCGSLDGNLYGMACRKGLYLWQPEQGAVVSATELSAHIERALNQIWKRKGTKPGLLEVTLVAAQQCLRERACWWGPLGWCLSAVGVLHKAKT